MSYQLILIPTSIYCGTPNLSKNAWEQTSVYYHASKGNKFSTFNPLFPNTTTNHSIIGGLQYLNFIRLKTSFSVNYVCQFMQKPTITHYQFVKRILRYLQGTIALGLRILFDSTLYFYGFSNVYWASFPSTCQSTSVYYTFLGSNYITWSAKK